MIIVLKNADFSQSNIGTLSTWRISRSLGAGATYNGPTSVDKGAAFSATVTLTEDYEIGTAGVTVTMGGTTLIGAHSISGKVITITIASVTGNVLIKVPTINTATGEEEEPEVAKYTFTINPSPSDATVTLTASGYTQSGNSITVASGTTVTWQVSKSGYTSQNGTQVVTSTSSKNITLNASSSANTVNLFKGNRTIVSSMNEMTDFKVGQALSNGSVLTNIKGRASDHTHALTASAGQKITLSQPIEGVTLAYAIVAFNANKTLAASSDKNFTAQAWLSDTVTLPANTAYIMIAFKRDDGASDFSESELALLPSALTIS
jgi:hypothetical protein